MKKRYTKHQILEAIKFWENVLKRIDESKSLLLNILFKTFKTNDLLKPFNGVIDDMLIIKCFNILNEYFFSSKLKNIPLKYLSDNEARKFLIEREMKNNDIPKIFFGAHSVLYDNDINTLKWTDELMLHDDVILLNSNHIDGKSISFLIACLCHEMIHYYDWLFGEYCDFTKYAMMTGIKKDKHNTMTFETMKNEANEIGIKVIQEIPTNKDAEILDKKGIELLYRKAKENGLILEKENRIKNCNIDGITFSIDKSGGSINTF